MDIQQEILLYRGNKLQYSLTTTGVIDHSHRFERIIHKKKQAKGFQGEDRYNISTSFVQLVMMIWQFKHG